jgi:hypothetical protein
MTRPRPDLAGVCEATWHVGQPVVVAWTYHRTPTLDHTTIAKVGRKYVTTANGSRFDIATGAHDGGEYASRGKLWPDEASYRSAVALAHWRNDCLQAMRDFTFKPTDAQLDDIAFIMGWDRKPTPDATTGGAA